MTAPSSPTSPLPPPAKSNTLKILLIVGIILLVLWLAGVFAFKVTKGLIHLVLLIAIIATATEDARAPAVFAERASESGGPSSFRS